LSEDDQPIDEADDHPVDEQLEQLTSTDEPLAMETTKTLTNGMQCLSGTFIQRRRK
jgi:hypothetical protein